MRLPLVLFLLTCLSTFAVGFVGNALPVLFGADAKQVNEMFTTKIRRNLTNGFVYAVA